MSTLEEMRARVRRATERSLAEADRLDLIHLDAARRAVASLAQRMATDGWQTQTRAALERLVYDQAEGAAQAFARMGRDHAATEVREISEAAGAIAQRAHLVPAPAHDLERLARDLVARLSPALSESVDPSSVLLSESSQVDRIVQTEGFRSYNAARQAVEMAVLGAKPRDVAVWAPGLPARRDTNWTPVITVVWDATLDERTCPTCESLSGKVRLLGMAFEGYPHPPLHPRCRCVAAFWPFALPT